MSAIKVVIAGGGFGGITAAKQLANTPGVDVTLITKGDHFEYHAALYRSATGRSVLEVAEPYSVIFAGSQVKVVNDEVSGLKDQAISTKSGATYDFDKLILALGSVTEYFGITGLPEFSYTMKSMDEAMKLKRHLHEQLSKGQNEHVYAVVGAGATGVELAAELVFYLRRIRQRHGVNPDDFNIMLIEAAPKILPLLPEEFSDKAHKRLEKLGIIIRTNTAVEGETAEELQLPGPDVKTQTVIWTAGVTNNPFFKQHEAIFSLAKGNRVNVNEHLVAAENIYVIGDSAATQYSGWAQTAIYDGGYVANLIRSELAGKHPLLYTPKKPIAAIPVGPKWCGVRHYSTQYFGYRGWLVRRLADFRLYRSILPLGAATRAWLAGNQVSEECPTCQ